jgi:CheY-like chemotaxis protein/HPt (histidine-containing phosphotransfer) domain-containing protein
MTQWDESINDVRKQLAELKATLTQLDQVGDSHKESIVDARSKIEEFLEMPTGARETLYQLPLVLGALNDNKLIGSLILGADGKVMMHNIKTQRLLPIDPNTGKLSTGTFYDPATGKLLSSEELPWQRCLRGEVTPPSFRMKMLHPEVDGEVHFEVGTVALRNEDSISAVVVLFVDATEPVKLDDYIKKLCTSLDKQVASIEAAHRELKVLADKLGVQPFGFDTSITAPSPSATSPPTPIQTATSTPTAPTPASAPAPAAVASTRPVAKNKVLLVDDIPVNHRLLIIQLKSFGVEIDLAHNGMEAVMMCQKTRYSLVFMDCDMPIMNGFEATEQIRKNEISTGEHLPIVAMTSYDRAGDREKCLASGMDDYLYKGVTRARLQEIIDRYVHAKEPESGANPPQATPATETCDPAKDILDLVALRQKFPGEADQILSLFLGSGSTLLNCLEFAIQEKDAAQVNHFAFSLKGPCATLGLSYMAATAASLTSDAEAGRWVEAANQYQGLRAVFDRLKAESDSVAVTTGASFSR